MDMEEEDEDEADEAGDGASGDAGDSELAAQGPTSGPLEDGFLDIGEMNDFADRAEFGKMRLDEDAGDDSDFGLLEAGDDDGEEDEEAKGMKFSDFFKEPEQKKDRKA